MVKFPREKEFILIGEDSFPPIASINTIAFDLKALTNLNNGGRIPPCPNTRKVWIPKHYLTYKMI